MTVSPSTAPQIVRQVSELRAAVALARTRGARIGLVPTMGALHAGHLSLVRAAQAECGLTVVSIFVNPTQFAPHEDFARYPRDLEADAALLAGCGVSLVFAPEVDAVYPAGFATAVRVRGVSEPWEGAARPAHFEGVATVVAKLFTMVAPDAAYFGEKDFQQLAVVRRMAVDLNLPVDVRACPIVREPDGLAMSSRNVYLSPDERRRGLALSQSLDLARAQFAAGERRPAAIREPIEALLRAAPVDRLDYAALVDPDTLAETDLLGPATRVLLAAVVGRTRLIDNGPLG